MSRARLERAALLALATALVALLTLPLLALLLRTGPDALAAGLRHPLTWPALRLSLLTTSATLALTLALGTPLAWLLASHDGRAARAVEAVLRLPIVLPPAAAGVALLLAFGREGVFKGLLYPEGSALSFSTAGVVIAETFVAAPFYVQAAIAAFQRIDADVLYVARSQGASPWALLRHVAMPLARPGLFAGAALCWARAVGEFGATLLFAGSLEGRTQTLPLALYRALEADLQAAQALAVLMLALAALVVVVARAPWRRGEAA